MPFIERNEANEISGLCAVRQSPGQEYLDDANEEVVAWRFVQDKAEAIRTLYEVADALALSCLDRNGRERVLGWMLDPAATAKIPKIQACIAWMDTVWQDYAATKAAIQAGNLTATLPERSAPPYDFWGIALTV